MPTGSRHDPPRLLDASALTRVFDVTAATIRNWIAAGRVRAVQTPGGRWKITAEEFERLKIKAQTSQTPQI